MARSPMTPQTGRRIHLALMALWIFPGIPVSYHYRNSVAWVVLLSVYAIIASHASGWSAERPTETA